MFIYCWLKQEYVNIIDRLYKLGNKFYRWAESPTYMLNVFSEVKLCAKFIHTQLIRS